MKFRKGLKVAQLHILSCPRLKQWPFKQSFSTSKITSTLNCFVLEHSISKTKELSRVLVTLLVLNKCLNGLGIRQFNDT